MSALGLIEIPLLSITALATAEVREEELSASAIVRCFAKPDSALDAMIEFPNAQKIRSMAVATSFSPADYPKPENKNMSNMQQAIGILETQGLTAILEATDAMRKSANVTLVGKEKIGAAYFTFKRDVAAVTAAVDAGSKAVGALGKLVAAHVIASPHEELTALLPK
jgi:hypothetical protein